MTKNLIFDLFWTPQIFSWILPLLVARHCSKLSSMQFKEKLMNLTQENGEKPNFEPSFGQNLGPQIFFREFYLY